MDLEEANNLNTPTPKLPLFTLRFKPPLDLHGGILTPPLHTAASIPFLWEEIPGKPRTTTLPTPQPPTAKSKAVRCLNLPPRLLITTTTPVHHHQSIVSTGSSNNYDKVLDQMKIKNSPSPTTVLAGPSSLSLSPEDKEDDQRKKKKKKKSLNLITSSWRWEKSFPANSGNYSSFRYHDNNGDSKKNNTSKVRRRSSFFSLTTSSSNFLANIYGGLKESVLRRQR